MSGPKVKAMPACPCCGQTLRRGWQRQPRWARVVSFGGRGRIEPLGDLWLTNPPDLVRAAATVSEWLEPPDVLAADVLAVADQLTLAGWRRHMEAAPPALPLVPAAPLAWPPPWSR